MLSPNVRFEAWTLDSWTRFVELWKPRSAVDVDRPRGGVIVVHENGRLQKIVHTKRGRLSPDRPWPVSLTELSADHGASWALSVERGALDEVMEQFGERAKREDDLLSQALLLIGIVHERMVAGEIAFWPHRLSGIPVPNERMVRRALDAFCEDGKCMALGLFRDGELWTGLCARRKGDGFDVLAGPEDIRLGMGLVSGDWRRDHRHFVRVCEEMYGPLSMGCFGELDRFRALQVDAEAGAWSRAVLLRELILAPIPAAVGVALGFDSARYAMDHARVFTERVDTLGLLGPLLGGIRARVGSVLGDKDVTSVLGFNPLDVLRLLLRR